MVSIKPNILFPDYKTKDIQASDGNTFIYLNIINKFIDKRRECWTYLGFLIVPSTHRLEIADYLKNTREEAEYQDKIQFNEMRSLSRYSRKTLLCRKWLKLALSEDNKRMIHFRILGLKLSKLQYQAYGSITQKQIQEVYNNFLRSIIIGCFEYDYKGYGMTITDVFINNELKNDELFDWHKIWSVIIPEIGIFANHKNIRFIDIDHQTEERFPTESHFMQLLDLILGATRQCLDNLIRTDGCVELGLMFLPLIEQLNDGKMAYNPYSRFSLYRQCSLCFFPNKYYSLKNLKANYKELWHGMYKERPLLIRGSISKQPRLF